MIKAAGMLLVKGGREIQVWFNWVAGKCESLGAGAVLLTSMDADGTAGYDLEC